MPRCRRGARAHRANGDGRKLPVEITLEPRRDARTACSRRSSATSASDRRNSAPSSIRRRTIRLTGLPNRTALARYLGALLGASERTRARRVVDARSVRASRKSTTRSATTSATRCCAKSRGDSRRSSKARRSSAASAATSSRSCCPASAITRAIDDLARAAHRRPARADRLARHRDRGRRQHRDRRRADHALDSQRAAAPRRRRDVRREARTAAGSSTTTCVDDHHTVRRLGMLSELRSAIENGGIALHYQPQIDLKTGGVTKRRGAACAGITRCYGNVSPGEFVTLAEATDLIHPLTYWAIRSALADLAELEPAGHRAARRDQHLGARASGRRVSAACSGSYCTPTAIRARADRARDHGERDARRSRARASCIVKELHGLGVLISIDDYGTGFSSLGYLARPARARAEARQVVRRRPRDARAESRHRRVDGADGARARACRSSPKASRRSGSRTTCGRSATTWRRVTCSRGRCRPRTVSNWILRDRTAPQRLAG